FKLTTVAIIFYGGNMISQVQGDSVYVESNYAKKFTGRISKVDQEGYFIKTSYNREIFLSKLEIKTIKVILELIEPNIDSKASTSFIDSNDVNTYGINAQKENPRQTNLEELIKSLENIPVSESTSELSEFYKKYNLANFDISSFNSPENIKQLRLFQIKINKHIRKNKSLSLKDRRGFGKNLVSEMSVNPNDEFLKYQKSSRLGKGIMLIGLASFTTGNIITFQSLTFTGIGTGGVVLIYAGALVMGNSSKWLFKSFYEYLQEKQTQ
ncbi:MAG: hypothetical protein VX134_03580, partial [Bacteroidota bacterium]|nr:hypothetical protein [Bacteroidota bacterium]